MATYEGRWNTVKVDVEDGIAWVTLNRPDKRNAMSPTLNREMIDVLETLELDGDAQVLVLTGAGESWSAGMDLKEYFRETDGQPEIMQERIRRDCSQWQWKLLRFYSSRPSPWSMAGASAAHSRRWWPAIWRSRRTTPCSACPRSTGASRRATW